MQQRHFAALSFLRSVIEYKDDSNHNKYATGNEQQITTHHPRRAFKKPGFQVVTKEKGKTMYIGDQDVVNAQGEIVGKGDITEQTEQVMKNLSTSLSACDVTLETSEWM